MSDGTHISWSDATWNIVSGCTRVSAGCDHCYIERTPPFRMATPPRRFDKPGIGGTTGVQLHPERLDQPMRWRKPRRIFVCSLADLFHDAVPDALLVQVFDVMANTHQHVFQVLTKRPARMRAFVRRYLAGEFGEPGRPGVGRLRDGIWLGVSVEDQKTADLRISILLDTPAAVRWISAEPLLGPIKMPRFCDCGCGRSYEAARDLARANSGWLSPDQAEADVSSTLGLDWVVAGGESGPGARPPHPDWFRTLRDQCQKAGVPFHFKQWGEWAPTGAIGCGVLSECTAAGYVKQPTRADPNHRYIGAPFTTHRTVSGAEIRMSPEMVRVGKRAAGRELDGVTHDAYPAGAR